VSFSDCPSGAPVKLLHEDFVPFIVSENLTFTNLPQSVDLIQFLSKCRGVRHFSIQGGKRGVSLLFIAKLCERFGYDNLDRITCDSHVMARVSGKPLQTILDRFSYEKDSLIFHRITLRHRSDMFCSNSAAMIR
jgi:hypothetical protein